MRRTIIATVLIIGALACSEHAHSASPTSITPSLEEVIAARTNGVITISLDTNETIQVEGRITLAEEIDTISDIPGLSNSTPFVIEAAANVRHYSIRRVMDSLAKQNFWNIRFQAQKGSAQHPVASTSRTPPITPTRESREDRTGAAEAPPQTDKAVLELLLGGKNQFQMYYMSTCAIQLDQFRREYPSVPQAFWDQYAPELENEWIKASISLVKTRFTEEQLREIANFATSPTGRSVVQEQAMILNDFQSESRQQAIDRQTKLESVLQKKGYKKAVSLQNCVYNLRLIDSAKEQYAMSKRLKKGDAVSIDKISPYIKGGFNSRVCPDGGKYTINSIGENPMCSVEEHKLD